MGNIESVYAVDLSIDKSEHFVHCITYSIITMLYFTFFMKFKAFYVPQIIFYDLYELIRIQRILSATEYILYFKLILPFLCAP